MNEAALLQHYLIVGALLFAIGLVGLTARRNLIVMFLATELMLQGISISLVAWSRFHNDWGGQMLVVFIIAVAAEEYGLILVLLIIALYSTLVVWSLMRLLRERDPFIRLAGTGLACMFGVQAMINMGVAVRLLPAKGMTLPFVSYGGSSIIASGIAVGMLLAFTRTRPQGQISDLLSRGRAR